MKKKLFEIKYDYEYVHCGDPWMESHKLIIYEDGSVLYEDFMDDRIPYRIKKNIKNDCADFFIRDLTKIIEKHKSYLDEYQGSQIENGGDGFVTKGYVEVNGYKKISVRVRNVFRMQDSIEEQFSNDRSLKDLLEEITKLVERYCLESLPIIGQLGY